jgi:hypothetical protein
VAAMLHRAVQDTQLEEINLKFMESGHKELEVDSMHSAIEFVRKYKKIYTPSGWQSVIEEARRDHPYRCCTLSYSDVFDYKNYASSFVSNKSWNTAGQKVNWLKIKWLKFVKGNRTDVFYGESFDPDGLMSINLRQCGRRNNAGRTK